MTVSRRGFLKLLGLTAAGTLVETTAPTSLFGAEGFGLATPDMGFHLVLHRRDASLAATGLENPSDEYLGQADGIVRTVQATFPEGWVLPMRTDRDSSLYWPVWKGEEKPSKEDLHLAFLRAATRIRDDFSKRSRELLMAVDPTLRPKVKLVTVVHEPVYLRNAIYADTGYEVAVTCETEIMLSVKTDGWEVYSEFGEVPIDPPSELDMGMLLEADTQIVTQSGNLFKRFLKGGGLSRRVS